MSKLHQLSTLEKRALLHSDDPDKETLLVHAESFLQDGRLYDALDFFEKTRDHDGLDRVRDAAVEKGDAGLLAWMDKNNLSEISSDQWIDAGENALKSSKFKYAARAFRLGGDERRANEVLEEVDQQTPSEKVVREEE